MAMCLPRRGSVPLVQLSRFPALNDRLYIYAECASVTRCVSGKIAHTSRCVDGSRSFRVGRPTVGAHVLVPPSGTAANRRTRIRRSAPACMWFLGPWAVWFNASPRPVGDRFLHSESRFAR
jgi:hypothetical protein